jgi:hypothetical protein
MSATFLNLPAFSDRNLSLYALPIVRLFPVSLYIFPSLID